MEFFKIFSYTQQMQLIVYLFSHFFFFTNYSKGNMNWAKRVGMKRFTVTYVHRFKRSNANAAQIDVIV